MTEMSINELEQVRGSILWNAAWTVIGVTVAAADASSNLAKGFTSAFESQKQQSMAENGWGA